MERFHWCVVLVLVTMFVAGCEVVEEESESAYNADMARLAMELTFKQEGSCRRALEEMFDDEEYSDKVDRLVQAERMDYCDILKVQAPEHWALPPRLR